MSGLFERIKSIPLSPFYYLDFYICLPLYTVFFLSGLPPSLYFIMGFDTAFSWEVAKSSTERSHIPFIQLSLIVVTPRILIVQEQNQEIDISTIHTLYSNVIRFIDTYLCVYVLFCAYAVFSCVDSCSYNHN